MSNIGAIFDVLANHSADVDEVVTKLGGVGNLIRVSPALVRLAMVVAKHKDDPLSLADRMEKTLYYNDETKDRVADFQRAHGLDVDGIIGNRTWSEIEKLLKQQKAKA